MDRDFELHGIETIKPVGKKVLVKLNPVEEKTTKGGIILPDLHHEEFRVGFILAIGDEVNDFKVGDKILVGWIFGDSVHIPDQGILDDTLRMGTQAAIWAKIEDTQAEKTSTIPERKRKSAEDYRTTNLL